MGYWISPKDDGLRILMLFVYDFLFVEDVKVGCLLGGCFI